MLLSNKKKSSLSKAKKALKGTMEEFFDDPEY